MRDALPAWAALAALVISGTASAHQAPSGWAYPLSCCSDQDCREIPADWIEERPDGYRVIVTDEIIPTTDARVRYSPDGRVHRCSEAGAIVGRTICLFMPPRSF